MRRPVCVYHISSAVNTNAGNLFMVICISWLYGQTGYAGSLLMVIWSKWIYGETGYMAGAAHPGVPILIGLA